MAKQNVFFDLADAEGTWLRCCAVDRHARHQDLVNGREVTLYFGSGRAGIGGSTGAVYLFKEAAIVPTGRLVQHSQKVAHLELL